MVWIEGDLGPVPGDPEPGPAPPRLHRKPSRRRRHHEAQAAGPAQHRHRPQPPGDRPVQLRPSGRAPELLRPRLPVLVRLRGRRAGLRRPALPAGDPPLRPALPLRLQRRGPCRAFAAFDVAALPGDPVRLSEPALRRDAAGLAPDLAAGEQPGLRRHRGSVVQLRAGPDALAGLRRPRQGRAAADPAQGGELGRMYKEMPPGERLSVLWAIMAVEAEEAGR